MTVQETMNYLLEKAKNDEILRDKILSTRKSSSPLSDFCDICNEYGFNIGIMDIISAGEEDYDLMRRSINGGGGNHLALPGEDDPYEMLMVELELFQ